MFRQFIFLSILVFCHAIPFDRFAGCMKSLTICEFTNNMNICPCMNNYYECFTDLDGALINTDINLLRDYQQLCRQYNCTDNQCWRDVVPSNGSVSNNYSIIIFLLLLLLMI